MSRPPHTHSLVVARDPPPPHRTDLNKLRFAAELDDDHPANKFGLDVFWETAPTLGEYLAATNSSGRCTRLDRLKWMLECTLGSPQAFEHRRSELALIHSGVMGAGAETGGGGGGEAGGGSGEANVVPDDMVVASFVDSVLPKAGADGEDGFVWSYITHGNLGVLCEGRDGAPGTLFVHGALDDGSLLFVPNAEELRYRDNRKVEAGCKCPSVVRGAKPPPRPGFSFTHASPHPVTPLTRRSGCTNG